MTREDEHQTLRACVEYLRALEMVRDVNVRLDRQELVLTTSAGRTRYSYQVKRALRAGRLDHLLLARPKLPRYVRPLVLTDYLSRSLIRRVAAAGVDFVDEAGNMLLRIPGRFYVRIEGAKPERLPEARTGGVLSLAAIRLVFVLLADKSAEFLTYRDLAQATDLSLASVSRALAALERRGFVQPHGRGRRVIRRKHELLELWVAGYVERLRPRLVIGRYRAPEKDAMAIVQRFADEAKRRRVAWALTGGLAADLLTGHYRAPELALFVNGWSSELGTAIRWMPSTEGQVDLFRPLSERVVLHVQLHRELPVADPLLVYAELLALGGDRERETARLIFERYLGHIKDGASS